MKETIHFRAGKLIHSSLYFSCDEYCGLFKMDIVSGKIDFLVFFPEEDVLQRFLHAKVLSYGEYLIFLPGSCGKNIHLYNYATGRIQCVRCFSERSWGGEAFISEGYLWMIPSAPGIQPVVKIDLTTLAVEKFPDFFGELDDNHAGDEEGRLLKRVVFDGTSIWFAILHSNEIVRISLCNHRIKKYYVSIKDLFGIFMANDSMWLTSYTDEYIYKWNPKTDEYEKCRVQGAKQCLMSSNNIFGIDTDVYALPYLSEYITKYNDQTSCFEKLIEYPEGFFFHNPGYSKFWNYDYDSDGIVCFPINADGLLLINRKENTALIYRADIEKDMHREPYQSISRKLFQGQLVIESSGVILKDYIQFIGTRKNGKQMSMTGSVGEKIYEASSDK